VPSIISIRDARSVICYPEPGSPLCEERIKELIARGLIGIVDNGPLRLGGIRVLGKGFSSIVVAAIDAEGRLMALKARRIDSRRRSLEREAVILSIASRHRLAPKIYWWTRDFIAMEYLNGIHIDEASGLGLGIREAKTLLTRMLGKVYVMDLLGIDHGELSRPYRHVMLVGLEPFFLDFESASLQRRPRNLSSLTSALILSGNRLSAFFTRFLGSIDERGVLDAMRLYKVDRSRGYRLLLEKLGLLPQEPLRRRLVSS
jgi:putative serine/threonine protein kinase